MKIKNRFIIVFLLFVQLQFAQQTKHWIIDNANQIRLDLSKEKNVPYTDNIEMSGKRVSAIVSYDIDSNKELSISREVFFPQLRTFIKTNDAEWKHYRAYFTATFSDAILPTLTLNNKIFSPGKVKSAVINGMLTFVYEPVYGIVLTRTFYPSTTQRLFVEQWTLTNTTANKVVMFGNENESKKTVKGVKGNYTLYTNSNLKSKIELQASESYKFSVNISATLNDEEKIVVNSDEYLKERESFLDNMKSSLTLHTPDKTLNSLFEFSKIRASESIFESKLGLIHSPGGGRYYVGFWANDQAEYVNPFFPYLGYDLANSSAINMYNLYTKEIKKDFSNIRYSFEMEGDVPINPLDRGDAAMIAYGAAQFALTSGDKKIAEKLWPLITWCLEYNKRQLNNEGVVISESDEMEGRIETGNANLSTSSLYYGALQLSANLGSSLRKPKNEITAYNREAKKLAKAIDSYFGATVEGLETYKYYKEHTNLRHWICLPLVVRIFNRKDDTTKALFQNLWSSNGVHVEKNDNNKAISEIFWDRGTLYALRGTFLAGATEESLQKLKEFSNKRLLGDRVPYVVEAFPEGNMAHLSAESGLYCRVFTEGMFGIVPSGLHSFDLTPRLPKEWNEMSLEHIKAFGDDFSILIERENLKIRVKIINKKGKVIFNKLQKPGQTASIKL